MYDFSEWALYISINGFSLCKMVYIILMVHCYFIFFPTALAATHNVLIIVPLCMSHRHHRMYI